MPDRINSREELLEYLLEVKEQEVAHLRKLLYEHQKDLAKKRGEQLRTIPRHDIEAV